jgi:hypothetical protein
MNNFRTYLVLLIAFCMPLAGAWAQKSKDDVVQINGVTMTADSLRAVPGVTILVKNQNRGVQSSRLGVFSIVVYKGDTLQFSSIGFRDKEYVVPRDIQGQYFSMIQLMVQDTFYLPETIINPYPSREEFDYAFRNERIPDDQYEIARKNTDALTLRALSFILPRDGREHQSTYQHQQAYDAVYYGQNKPNNIMNPLAWAEFFEAWKRGDFRKKYNR